ncbi:hypothetical protein KKG82_05980 [Patescibacteria group bacterium]|nr:hypothetical protein [Patescibacteria group bacterium]
MFSFWKHHTDEDRQADWQVCVDKIKEASTLKILGATGWETFAEDGSPLHKAVLSFPGEIKVLLMSPEAECLEKRVSSLGDVSKSDYIAQINKTIDFCKLLRKKSIKIHLKLYDQHPIWKMVIADGFLWLQHYRDRTHVDQTPVYGVYANKEETSLYYPLSEVFYKRWELDNNTEINLDG